jgi:hypothetical protein
VRTRLEDDASAHERLRHVLVALRGVAPAARVSGSHTRGTRASGNAHNAARARGALTRRCAQAAARQRSRSAHTFLNATRPPTSMPAVAMAPTKTSGERVVRAGNISASAMSAGALSACEGRGGLRRKNERTERNGRCLRAARVVRLRVIREEGAARRQWWWAGLLSVRYNHGRDVRELVLSRHALFDAMPPRSARGSKPARLQSIANTRLRRWRSAKPQRPNLLHRATPDER